MPDLLRFASCGETWIWLMRHVTDSGGPALDDRGPIIEAPAVLFEINALSWDDPILACHGDPGKIPLYASKFSERSIVPPFKYSYGGRLRQFLGVDQLGWISDVLRAKPYTKSGWISLTAPGEPPDAVPCLTSLAFRLRAGRLVMTAAFRSQNAYTCYLNYVPLRGIQREVADGLTVGCGPMRVFVDVPHIYTADEERVRRILRPMERAGPKARTGPGRKAPKGGGGRLRTAQLPRPVTRAGE